MDGLEDVCLPGAIRTDERGHAPFEVDLPILVAAEVLERDRGDTQ